MTACWPGVRPHGHIGVQGNQGEREEDNVDMRDETRAQGRDRGGKMIVEEGHATPTGTRMDPATSI